MSAQITEECHVIRMRHEHLTEIQNIFDDNVDLLDLSYNQITEIKNLETLAKLKMLILIENEITEIKNLPENLEKLYLEDNPITEIKNLPENLKELHIKDNLITEIKNLPKFLLALYINMKNIIDIDLLNFPDTCKNEMCESWYIKKIHVMKKYVLCIIGIWAVMQLQRIFRLELML